MLVDELIKNMQMGKQTDFILVNLSNAFDKIAHEKRLLKLHQYGIRGDTLKWIKDFLDNRKQTVVINGIISGLSSWPNSFSPHTLMTCPSRTNPETFC